MGKELAALVLILAVYGVLLGRTATHGFVWDDVREIEHNTAFDKPLAEGLRLTQTERAAPELADLPALTFGYDSYRPLLYASYWLDIHTFGREPKPLHVMNVIFGGLAVLAAYLFARRWLGSAWALVPTALFALHPIQIEAVAYVSGRGDVLAGLFVLIAAWACLRDGVLWTLLVTVAFAASLLAKESYLAFPLAAAMLAFAGRARWANCLAAIGVAIGYVVLREAVVKTSTAPAYLDAGLALPGYVIEYLRIVALPFDLTIERVPRDYLLVGWGAVVGATALLLLLYVTRGLPRWGKDALTGITWLVVLLAPSAIAIATMHVLADRYFYAPMVGLGVAIAAAASGLYEVRPRLLALVALPLLAWFALVLVVAWRQVDAWRDADSLYHHAAELAPDSSRAQYRVAYLDIQRNRWDLAVPRLERAIALDPRNTSALNNLGVYRLRTGQLDEAERLLGRAIAVNPARFNSWLNLGLAQHAQGKRDAGCASIARSLAINPSFEDARREQARLCKPR